MQQPRDFSLYGAVDLGARQAAAQRSQQASRAGGPNAPGSDYVFDVTDATFEKEVLERSRTVPVVLDLWATWCGPCRQLSPVLEKLAAEAAGAWVLAKVDVDANPQLSQALQVQSIPTVVAVVNGQLVPLFQGAMPEAQVRQVLEQLMKVAEQLGARAEGGQAGPAEEEPVDPGLEEARQAMERGDLTGAAAVFERMLADSPGDPVATMGLAQVNLFLRVHGYDEAALRRQAAASPDDVDVQSKVADIDLSFGKAEDAFDRMLGLIRRTTGEDRNRARVHLLGLFEIFPPRDPQVTKARAALSSLLF